MLLQNLVSCDIIKMYKCIFANLLYNVNGGIVMNKVFEKVCFTILLLITTMSIVVFADDSCITVTSEQEFIIEIEDDNQLQEAIK